MTHSGGKPHTNVGDRGQRYEVRAVGYPKTGQNVIGWSPEIDGARRMAAAIKLAPSCADTSILDRETGEVVQ